MDMTHVTEFSPNAKALEIADELPMQMGSGAIDPQLIEPKEPDPDVAELIAFRCSTV